MRRIHFAVIAAIVVPTTVSLAEEADPAGVAYFEKHIRPVLVKQCYECHSTRSKEVKGGLLLDTREGIRQGGETGPAVVPKDKEGSLLLEALHYESFEMPPKEQLPNDVIAAFETWVEMGAPDPRDGKSALIRRTIDIEEGRRFWAFQPIENPPVPEDASGWSASDVDRFVMERLRAKGIEPVGDAEPAVLVRRVYFDLIGLPPTPAQQLEYTSEPTPERFAEIVDRLLGSRQFAERWGRHWLDVVRFAESTGMERNYTYPHAWRYRDYVIDAFEADKPFDDFVREQVAGDLLESGSRDERYENHVATGLLAIGPKSLNERNREQFAMDIVDEQIDVTTRAFLGVTVACARCHDHKFDPFPQKDYYALAGVFRSTDVFYGTGGGNGNRQAGSLLGVTDVGVSTVAPKGGNKGNANQAKKQLAAAKKRVTNLQKQLKRNPDNETFKTRLAQAEKQVARLQLQLRKGSAPKADDGAKPTLVMGVRDAGKPADTALLVRGEIDDRGDVVARRFPQVVTRESPAIANGSGRLEYAHWIVADENPLTARVAVNRIWAHLLGQGIVSTVNNFGVNGTRPSHPELLDHLATRFRENGWSQKAIIREIVTSRVYRLGVAHDLAAAEADPGNDLLWRANHRRLEAEAIRDAILHASGQLDLEPAESSVVAKVGDGNVGRGLDPSAFAADSTKRSVYLPIVRNALPEALRVFDFPEPSIIAGQREVTTVPTQALYMLNSPFVLEQSQHMAKRLLDEEMDDAERIDLAYHLTLCRQPTDAERARALAFVTETTASNDMNRETAFAGLCQALFASAEFRYVE